MLLALSLVAIVSLAASPLEVGLVSALQTAPFLLIGLPAGAWVDRLRRRSVLIVGDVGRAAVLVTVPVAWWAGARPYGLWSATGSSSTTSPRSASGRR
jgi:MFS family permease